VLELRDQDEVNAGIVLDLGHYLGPEKLHSKDFSGYWEEVLGTIQGLAYCQDKKGNTIPLGLHIPIGEFAGDSIPIHNITPDMWKRFVKLLNNIPNLKRVAIENLIGKPIDYIMPQERNLNEARNRATIVFDRIQENIA
jgi:hypothetical protein